MQNTHPFIARTLADHELLAALDLARLNYPPANWVKTRTGPDNKPLIDVLIVGAGMCGQTAAFALLREGVRNIRIIDSKPHGKEGPWGTYARMPTLRSPKQINGPDLGIPSLTFRAWYEAQHGAEGWADLYKISRLDWLNYLLWIRRVAGIPVENNITLRSVDAEPEWICATLEQSNAQTETVYARKVVLALGREGSGDAKRLTFPSFDPETDTNLTRVFHSSDEIDFKALKGKRISILGAGASSFDNAGTALEAGATSVTMFARRPHLPQVNKSKWSVFSGFMRGYAALDTQARWRMYTYIFDEQSPPPHESVLRCEKHAGFSIRFSEPWLDMQTTTAGVNIHTSKGAYTFDTAILATGFSIDLPARQELASIRGSIALWKDHVPAEVAASHPVAARFPFLGKGFELTERVPGSKPGLERIHIFNWGSTMSHGALSSDIPGMATGALRLADNIVQTLFSEDEHLHYASLLAFEDPELAPTSYFIERDKRSSASTPE